MHRDLLLRSLAEYRQMWGSGTLTYETWQPDEEHDHVTRLEAFVRRQNQCFERSCLEGHITGSALVTNPSGDRVLLTLHAKLGKWLQLGGHTDGDHDVARSALREAQEESGRDEVKLLAYEQGLGVSPPLPFDCDIHSIPARHNEPEHFHYDIRYLCVLDDSLPLVPSSESKALRWLSLDEAVSLTTERSMLRQFAKLAMLRPRCL
jgi:8-oxo-dGTP pyrophosphatase MutT (NUDIX family)